jgi:ferric-dicitrate binding protein FerR (iron transport regulator)
MGGARAFGLVRVGRSARAACVLTLLSVAPGLAAEKASAEPEVGTAVLIKKMVTGKLGADERQLQTGFRIHRNEFLQTGPQAQAELKLDDNTKLALGPDAELRLDEYAVATGNDTKTIALKLLKGTFRLLTGSNASASYKIETPSATIGVRGTIFDVYIGPGGDTFVLLHQGEVEVCSRARTCRPHRDVGRVVRATIPGIVSKPMKWTANLVPGVGVAQAFPFVGARLIVDPVRRLTHNAITDRVTDPVVKGTKRVIEQGGETIGRTLRKLSPF